MDNSGNFENKSDQITLTTIYGNHDGVPPNTAWGDNILDLVEQGDFDIISVDSITTVAQTPRWIFPIKDIGHYKSSGELFVVGADFPRSTDFIFENEYKIIFDVLSKKHPDFNTKMRPPGGTPDIDDGLMYERVGAYAGAFLVWLGIEVNSRLIKKERKNPLEMNRRDFLKMIVPFGFALATGGLHTWLVDKLIKDIGSSKTTIEQSQLAKTMNLLKPIFTNSDWLGIRNARMILGLINFGKSIASTNPSKKLKLGAVFGSGHTFAEHDAFPGLFDGENIETMESRLIGYMKLQIKSVYDKLEINKDNSTVYYEAFKFLFAFYTIYNIPQGVDNEEDMIHAQNYDYIKEIVSYIDELFGVNS